MMNDREWLVAVFTSKSVWLCEARSVEGRVLEGRAYFVIMKASDFVWAWPDELNNVLMCSE